MSLIILSRKSREDASRDFLKEAIVYSAMAFGQADGRYSLEASRTENRH